MAKQQPQQQQQQRSEQTKRVQAARASLLLDQPFFGVLALSLKLTEDPTCKTAWTDGRSLGYNPKYVDTLSQDELVGLIAHEVLHPASGHPWRKGARNHKKYNRAADYAINPIVLEAGFKLPPGGLIDPQYAGKASEWIYDRLPDEPEDNDGNDGNGDGNGDGDGCGCGEVRDAPDGTDPGDGDGDGTPAPTESDWQQTVKQALQAAQGKLPASLKREIDRLLEPAVDWRALLRRFITDACKADYTWRMPNVRYLAHGLYMPRLHAEAMGKIVVAVDTSGSIDGVLLSQFAAEISSIASELQPSSVEVVYCDAQVNRVDVFERGEAVEISACGGGGTSFVPVFDHVDASDEAPAVLVYLTDMYGSFPQDAPAYPVLWASYSSVADAPFGEVVPCV